MPPIDPGKPRPARIALDYFKRGDGLRWWKVALTVVATAVVLAWWLSGYLRSDAGRLWYSRGPVASVHAMWDDKCEACHTAFQPIQSDAWFVDLSQSHDGNAKCQTCHEGPPHHAVQAWSPNCAECHREHRGREASLLQMADTQCTRCHADLSAHVRADSRESAYENAVAEFNLAHHPEFRVTNPITKERLPLDKARDGTHLEFNHKLHMTEGMRLVDGGKPFRYRDIGDPLMARRYLRQLSDATRRVDPGVQAVVDEAKAQNKPVQLTCAACHQLDAKDFAGLEGRLERLPNAALLPAPSAGAYMQPIIYEWHCEACHPLTFDREPAAAAKAGYVSTPHRLQPGALHEFLENYYTAQLRKDKRGLFERKPSERVVPGKAPEQSTEPDQLQIARQVDGAEKRLYLDKSTCGECHHYEKAEGQVVPERILPPNVPTVWLPHAKFNHTSHRTVECRGCHPGADPKAEAASTRASDILLPGIAVCVQCHAPSRGSSGGARFDCAECHRYHNGDVPLHGLGAEQRQPRKPRGLDDLLGAPRP